METFEPLIRISIDKKPDVFLSETAWLTIGKESGFAKANKILIKNITGIEYVHKTTKK